MELVMLEQDFYLNLDQERMHGLSEKLGRHIRGREGRSQCSYVVC